MVGFLAFIDIPTGQQKWLDYRATPSEFIEYSIMTKQYIMYNPLANTLHPSRVMVIREEKWYTAQNATDQAILNEHFHRDITEKPKLSRKQPTRDESSKHRREGSAHNDSPPEPQMPKKESWELDCLDTSVGN